MFSQACIIPSVHRGGVCDGGVHGTMVPFWSTKIIVLYRQLGFALATSQNAKRFSKSTDGDRLRATNL